TERNARKASARILSKHERTLLASALESVGVSKLTLALKIKELLSNPETGDRETLTALKMALTAMGGKVDGNRGVNGAIAAAPKSLVFIAEDDSIRNMLTGKKKTRPSVTALPAPEPSEESTSE